MKLSEENQRKVEENLGLVHKVINDKVHGPYQLGIYTREDLFQIGCIGLCKAAATDKGGNFSTYAYRLIWNQIKQSLMPRHPPLKVSMLSDSCQRVTPAER